MRVQAPGIPPQVEWVPAGDQRVLLNLTPVTAYATLRLELETDSPAATGN